jgi:hypothetical protein
MRVQWCERAKSHQIAKSDAFSTHINLSKARWLLHVLRSLLFKHSTSCPNNVCMSFMCIWEQIAIISLYSINWLVFITETECVYCAVGTEPLNTIQVNLRLSRAVPWLRRLVGGLLPRRPRFDPRSIRVRSVDKVALGMVFLRIFRFLPFSIIPPMLHTHVYLRVALMRRTNWRRLGSFLKVGCRGNRWTVDKE